LKKIIVLISLLFSLSACNSKNGDHLLINEQGETTTYSTSSQVIESPEYINESLYSGNELDIIRLINQRIKYTFEENESKYMGLFHATSPINGLLKYKLKTVKLLAEIKIQEQKYSFVALVQAEDIVISGDLFNNNYVFIKAKNNNDGWKIGDID
jgi:hypothetical protein